MAEAPIFVTGLARTGKTPLRIALDATPGLALSRKARLWQSLHGRFGDLSVPTNLERCIAAVVTSPDAAPLAPDADAIRRALSGRDDITYAALFGAVHAEHARREGMRRWGEQDAEIARHAEEILRTWPAARVIHLVRRPSQWVTARSRRWPGGVASELATWTQSAHLALHNHARHPAGYLIVRFEDMAHDPATTLATVGAFLGEDLSVDPLAALDAALLGVAPSGLGSVAGRYVDERTHDLLAALGYPDTAPAPSIAGPARSLARLWFGSPRGVAA